MRKILYLSIFITVFMFTGCQDDDEIKVETGSAEFVNAHSARINGIMEHNGNNTGYPIFYLAKTRDPGPGDILVKPNPDPAGYYTAILGVLDDNTTYYYKHCVNDDINGNILCGDVKSFTTPKAQTFTDERDGQTYEYVEIGHQTWMAENLNYASEKSVALEDEDGNTPYGRAYFYEEHEDICPAGWHVPSDEQWKTLEKRMGVPDSVLNEIGVREGDLTDKWLQPNILTKDEKDPFVNSNNESGLDITPLGGYYIKSTKEFVYPYPAGVQYMTSTFSNENREGTRYYFRRRISPSTVRRDAYSGEGVALYVRCIKD